ncbi:MAG: hypothetical protein IT352_07535 [Gemmatimonadales bacterium]|nr:hypothetical protein [Gemmatimonadales bacterium]
MLHAERLGIAWHPDRWRTRDGYIPYRVLMGLQRGLAMVWAQDRLQVARGTALGRGGREARSAWDADVRLMQGKG